MKKLIFIIFVGLLITAVSCKKEIICPNNTTENQTDIKNPRDKDFGNNDSSNDATEKSNSSKSTHLPVVSIDDSLQVITDPNRDEDDIKKDKPN